MNESLNVVVRDLPTVRVALLEYKAKGFKGEYQESIGMLFREVEGWLALRGFNVDRLRRFGVPFTDGPMLQRYWCCIEAPEGLMAGEDAVQVRELAGGRYAVLSLVKDATTIGPSIDRFYSEYVPAHGLTLDETRPPIEVYYPETMDYCAPVS
jgi:AraC family transcriptional regulator